MALQNVEILEAMERDLGKRLKGLRVDGGAAENKLLMQLQSDYLGSKILKPKILETTVAGAAYLAGLGVGFWSDLKEIRSVWKVHGEFQPEITKRQREQRLASWRKALSRTMM